MVKPHPLPHLRLRLAPHRCAPAERTAAAGLGPRPSLTHQHVRSIIFQKWIWPFWIRFPQKNMLDPSFLTDLHVSSDFPWKPMGLGALYELRRRVQRGGDHGGCWTGASVQPLPRHGFPWRFRPSINGDFMVIETNKHGIYPLKCTQSNNPKLKWVIMVILTNHLMMVVVMMI